MKSAMSTSRRIAERLRAQISTGRLAPGTALRQESLAVEFRVSRMPIRDALNQLHTEQLVDLIPNRGAFVASMSADECVEIFELRAVLECDALTRAVPQHTDQSLRRLQQVQRDLEIESDATLWTAGDRQFHEALYAPCERKRTLQLIATLRNTVERFYLANLTHDSHRHGWKGEHRGILKAVANNDADAACACLRTHLRETQKVVIAAMLRS